MSLKLTVTNATIDFDIEYDNNVIGYCCIDPIEHKLYNFHIYPQYQNKGYAIEALSILINKYDINSLDVYSDNEKAIHIYEKFGFKINNNDTQLLNMKREV